MSVRQSWAGPSRTLRRAPDTGRLSSRRIKGAGDGLGPAKAALPGPELGWRATGGSEAKRPGPGGLHGRMTQHPPPGRHRRPASRSQEQCCPQPLSFSSVPRLKTNRRRDRRSPRVARVDPGSASPQPALTGTLPLSRPAPANARHARTTSLPGPWAFGGRIPLLVPGSLSWVERGRTQGCNDSTRNPRGKEKEASWRLTMEC